MLSLWRLWRKIIYHNKFALLFIIGVFTISIMGNSLCFWYFDGQENPKITFWDSLWYSFISISTVGYGDFSAQTVGARLGTLFFIFILGLGAFVTLSGMIIDGIGNHTRRGAKGMIKPKVGNHVLIVNFPSEQRVKQIIEEIRSAPGNQEREIVVIADSIDIFPIIQENVFFVRGSVLSEQTYKKASVESALRAIVLATSYSDFSSDAVCASSVGIIERLNRNVYTVAECLDSSHLGLFRNVHCDAIISGMEISGNLLVQEAQDPGVSALINEITSNRTDNTLFSTVVEDDGVHYGTLAQSTLPKGITIIGVVTDNSLQPTLDIKSKIGDKLIYIAKKRYSWGEI